MCCLNAYICPVLSDQQEWSGFARALGNVRVGGFNLGSGVDSGVRGRILQKCSVMFLRDCEDTLLELEFIVKLP